MNLDSYSGLDNETPHSKLQASVVAPSPDITAIWLKKCYERPWLWQLTAMKFHALESHWSEAKSLAVGVIMSDNDFLWWKGVPGVVISDSISNSPKNL